MQIHGKAQCHMQIKFKQTNEQKIKRMQLRALFVMHVKRHNVMINQQNIQFVWSNLF